MIKLDAVRVAFEAALWTAMTAAHFDYVKVFPNRPAKLDNAKIHVITGFLPGQTRSEELGGAGALGMRDGVFMVTLSMPHNIQPSTLWQMAEEIEGTFRRLKLTTTECHAWCGEPYTENRGSDPEGRYSISTTIPWTVAYS